MNPNWELQNCCNRDQKLFLVNIGVFIVVILVLWRTFILTPFKLITVFLHEASHAIACKLTCGQEWLLHHLTQLHSDVFCSKDCIVLHFFLVHYIGNLVDLYCGVMLKWRILIDLICWYLQVEGMQVHANEGGVTQTRGGVYWLILPAGYLGSSFWGMVLILASTNLLTAKIAAGCFIAALLIVLFIAKNWTLRGLCIGFIIFIAVIWVLQELTKVRILRYVILFIGVMNSLFSVYDIYDDLISRRVHSSDAEKFAELCPCPCNGIGWGVIWGMISFIFLCGAMYLGLVILS